MPAAIQPSVTSTRRALLLLAALLALSVTMLPRSLPGQAARASVAKKGDPLDRAVAAWRKVKTVRASFEQTIENSLTGGTLRTSGEFQQQRPGRLSVSFNGPGADRIVADGKFVWLYLPSTAPGQVIRSSLREGGTGTMDLTAQFLTAPRSRYTVTSTGRSTIGGRAMQGYSLVPKSRTGAPFTKAVVHVDAGDATIRQFTVTENSGIERTVRLTSLRTNVPVQASAFVFTPPAGTRIISR